jgi:hypothetical protein
VAFWPAGPDGDTRRKNGPVLREYKATRDTMACQFYDRFARRSPCETTPKLVDLILRVVIDGQSTPLAQRAYRLSVQGTIAGSGNPVDQDYTGTTDDLGYVRQKVPLGVTSGSLTIIYTGDDGKQTDVWTLALTFQDLAAIDTVQGVQSASTISASMPGARTVRSTT